MPAELIQDSASVSLAAQDTVTLRKVFRSLTADSCPHSYNFHMHTIFSDGKLQPVELMEQAIAIGLKGLAITDHHSVGGYRIAQQWLAEQISPAQSPLPHLWTGVEINANLLDIEVHILAYGFDPDHAAMQVYLHKETTTGHDYQAKQVIDAIHAAGGLAVMAHPARYRLSPKELIPAAAPLGLDAVETYYSYNNPVPWRPTPQQTEMVQALAETYHLLSTCGTDTHGKSLLQRL